MSGWIGVDLDGTLAHYEGWDDGKIGYPITRMVERVKKWLAEGKDVRIMTARVSCDPEDRKEVRLAIQKWCTEHIGRRMKITHEKDFMMTELWDDRAVQVIPNDGTALQEYTMLLEDVVAKLHNIVENHIEKGNISKKLRKFNVMDAARQIVKNSGAK